MKQVLWYSKKGIEYTLCFKTWASMEAYIKYHNIEQWCNKLVPDNRYVIEYREENR